AEISQVGVFPIPQLGPAFVQHVQCFRDAVVLPFPSCPTKPCSVVLGLLHPKLPFHSERRGNLWRLRGALFDTLVIWSRGGQDGCCRNESDDGRKVSESHGFCSWVRRAPLVDGRSLTA